MREREREGERERERERDIYNEMEEGRSEAKMATGEIRRRPEIGEFGRGKEGRWLEREVA